MQPTFTQTVEIQKTGFGNLCKAVIGVPTPEPNSILYGSTLVDFDRHPYMAKSGFGNLDPAGVEQEVPSCHGVLIKHYDGMTRTVIDMDYSKPRFWGLPGQSTATELYKLDDVGLSSDITEVSFEVDYDSTAYVVYNVDRAAFQYVVVELDGVRHRYENIACLPKEQWQAMCTFRMWGQTDSWGSEGEKLLVIPFADVR